MSTINSHIKNDTQMVKEFVDGFIVNLTYAIGVKSFKIKLLYSTMFTIMLSPVAICLLCKNGDISSIIQL